MFHRKIIRGISEQYECVAGRQRGHSQSGKTDDSRKHPPGFFAGLQSRTEPRRKILATYKKKYTKGKIFSGLDEMKDYVADILKNISEKTVASIVGYPYILNAINV